VRHKRKNDNPEIYNNNYKQNKFYLERLMPGRGTYRGNGFYNRGRSLDRPNQWPKGQRQPYNHDPFDASQFSVPQARPDWNPARGVQAPAHLQTEMDDWAVDGSLRQGLGEVREGVTRCIPINLCVGPGETLRISRDGPSSSVWPSRPPGIPGGIKPGAKFQREIQARTSDNGQGDEVVVNENYEEAGAEEAKDNLIDALLKYNRLDPKPRSKIE